MRLRLFLLLIFSLIALDVQGATYYARENGGCPKTSSGSTDPGCANICNGTVNVDYSAGVSPNCAYNHPYWAIPANGQDTTYRLSGGDELVITGTFRVGCLAGATCRDPQYNMTNSATCDSTYSYDCKGISLPDGSAGNPTEVIGCSTSGCGCSKTGDTISCSNTMPILWSAGRSNNIFNLDGADYVKIKDIEMTDHAAGSYSIETVCNTGDYTRTSGLNAIFANSGSNFEFDYINIHGMCQYGLLVGGINTFSMTNSILTRNGWSAWGMDSCAGAGTCGVTGNVTLTNNTITYSGCTEDYPSIGLKTNGCHAQADGIISDGIESADSAGAWTITGNNISWNTHDGPDLLYVNKGSYSGGTVVYRRNRFEGNGGNQIKGPNAVTIEDNMILGNCGYFTGQTFTSATWDDTSDSCRASGNTIAIAFRDNTTTPKIINNTILSNGDVGIETSGSCTAGTDVITVNNILLGGRQHNDDTAFVGGGGNDTASIYFDAGACDADFAESYNLCYGWKEGASACDGTGSSDNVAPSFVGGTIPMGPDSSPGYYGGTDLISDVYLSSADNGADESVSGADSVDYNNYDRGASWDRGGVEYGSTPGEGGGGGSSQASASISNRAMISGTARIQ